MSVAQKMVLIPESEYLSLLNQPQNKIKRDIKEVLKGKRDHESATKMSQLVGSYLRSKRSRKPPPLPQPKQQDFLEFFEPIYHKKIKHLLTQLKDNGIGWTDNNELLLANGAIVPNSNMVHLIKEALVGTRQRTRTIPIGWQEFLQAIAASNIPKSFFRKKSTSKDLAELQRGHEWEMY